MASPNGNLDEVHEGLLLQAVRASWLAKKKQARIDDVVDFLKTPVITTSMSSHRPSAAVWTK